MGGDAPIVVRNTTNTEICDAAATVTQVRRPEDAGADIMQVSVPNTNATEAFGKIR